METFIRKFVENSWVREVGRYVNLTNPLDVFRVIFFGLIIIPIMDVFINLWLSYKWKIVVGKKK